MSTIFTRQGKGLPLTNSELDANFINLNADKLEAGALAPYLTSAIAAATYQTLQGYTPANKAGDTFTGNVLVNAGADSLLQVQSSGVTQGQFQATATAVRLASNNALPLYLSQNGVDLLDVTTAAIVGNRQFRVPNSAAYNFAFVGEQAAGAGKYNLYMSGTAQNYLAGSLGIGTNSADRPIHIKTATGGAEMRFEAATPGGLFSIGASSAANAFVINDNNASATRFQINANGAVSFTSSGTGTSGQMLKSGGSGAAPSWALLTSGEVTTALGFTPANKAGDTFTGNLTLNAGTANGVAYLNGSKVLTTGTGLTFDGTTFTSGAHTLSTGNLSFTGTAQRITGDFSNATLANRVAFQTTTLNTGTHITAIPNGTAATSGLKLETDSALTNGSVFALDAINGSDMRIAANIRGTGSYLPITFVVGGGERVRIDTAGNVGIGTSSPTARLHVTGDAIISTSEIGVERIELGSRGTGDRNSYIDFHSSGLPGAIDHSARIIRSPGVNGIFDFSNTGSGAMTFAAGGGERMRLDSSGNLGLGVTPSTYSQGRALDIGSNVAVWASGGGNVSMFNANFNSGYKYKTTDVASMYVMGASHQWYTAPSGTAGNAITFTQAMTLTAAGNLGIGTSSPLQKLQVSGNILANNLYFGAASSSAGTLASDSGSSGGRIVLWGSTSPGAGNIELATPAGASITFATSGTERARIDSSGNLLVGVSATAGSRLYSLAAGAAEGSGYFRNSATSGISADQFQIGVGQAAGTGYHFIRVYSSVFTTPDVQFAVRGDGTVYAQNTTIQSLSDIRTKENVRNASDGLQTILGLRPVRFDFKEGFGNNRKNQLGFIAQEVEAVFPDAVDVAGDKDENGDPYKSVGPGAMIPVLVKAIQELNAKVEALTTEIQTLKGTP